MSSILGITIQAKTRSEILNEIRQSISINSFIDIVSLNPEIMVMANSNPKFKSVIQGAQLRLVDGVGVTMAGKLLNVPTGERVTGVSLMQNLIKVANEQGLRVLLVGGFGTVAHDLSQKLQKTYNVAVFKGIKAYDNVKKPSVEEEEGLIQTLQEFDPQMIFVAFGAPYQEFWITDHKKNFPNAVCMSVGGSFDFLSGNIKRAPGLFQKMGLEWLFRLIVQPWRIRRQLRLLTFIMLVLRQKSAQT